MSLLTDRDITKLQGKDIVIDNYVPEGLTPIGYDFHVGDFVYCLDSHNLLEPVDENYMLPPESTILILTKESLWVSKNIAGLIHSKVSLVTKGFSHIATTVDPNWFGPLLITLRNNNKTETPLKKEGPFVTLVMFKVSTPTETKHNKPASRADLLIDLLKREPTDQIAEKLKNQITKYVDTVKPALSSEAQQRFQKLVEEAKKSSPDIAKIKTMNFFRSLQIDVITISASLLLFFLCSLSFVWSYINPIFGNIQYDSTVVAGQITGMVAIGLFLLARVIKQK